MKKDPELNWIKSRSDYRTLLAELEKKSAVK
jgi:hypothetical protein